MADGPWSPPRSSHPATASVAQPDLRLLFELDGAHHEADFDEQRDADALLEGVLVIRFANHEVTGDIDAVLNEIHSWIKYRSGPGTQARRHHASPSPAAGEGD